VILTLPVVAACKSVVPVEEVRVAPPIMPVIQQQHVEPVAVPAPNIAQRETPIDAVALIIVEAQLRFERGEDLYKQGFLKKAKEEFDNAIDILLESSTVHPQDPRLQREITELVSRVYTLELAAIREGDGFTDQVEEHAAIDDLEHVETFPAAIDPKLKQQVEEEIGEIAHDLPIEINDRVLTFLTYYGEGRGRSTIERALERVGRYQPMIEQILQEEGVPLDLIYLCQAESAFQPRALSSAKAKGMWQFISSRGKEYGLRQTWWIDERSDPEKSTRAAARHLKDLYQEFGDWYLAMAAYNAGPVRIHRAMEKTGDDSFWKLADKRALPKETIKYIPNILALTIIGKNPEKYGFHVEPAPALETERVPVDKATDLRVIAETLSLPLEDLRNMNAHVLRWTTPPDDSDFELVLPKGYAEKFNQQIASLPQNKRVLFREHVVRKGDTLGGIARKYGSTANELAQANNLGPKRILRVGQTMIIPMSGISPTMKAIAAKSTSPAKTVTYTVQRGDTLAKIAARFHTSPAKLKALNHLTSARLTVGKKLLVTQQPVQTASRKVVHQVRQGETLDRIATTYKTSVDAILSWNETNDLSVIHPGDRITIFVGDNN
jgi:peptidoglycan lytic transglycosylase D